MKNIKSVILFLNITIVLFSSAACSNQLGTSQTNTSHNSETGENMGEVEPMSKEEQFQKSDLVYLITAGNKGKAINIEEKVYTFYSIEIEDILKGEEAINSILLYGDTTDDSSVSSSIDESLIRGMKYKIFLKKKGEYYFTTAGFQSIILVDE